MADLNKLQALTLASIEQLVGDGENLDVPAFAAGMRTILARGHLAAALAGSGERSAGDRARQVLSGAFRRATGGAQQEALDLAGLSAADRKLLDAALAEQLQYLRGFVQALPGLSPAQIVARARMYSGAVRTTYSTMRWGMWDLPYQPGEGTECLSNCRCRWEIEDTGDGTGRAFWRLAAAEHCPTCVSRAAKNPYSVRRKR